MYTQQQQQEEWHYVCTNCLIPRFINSIDQERLLQFISNTTQELDQLVNEEDEDNEEDDFEIEKEKDIKQSDENNNENKNNEIVNENENKDNKDKEKVKEKKKNKIMIQQIRQERITRGTALVERLEKRDPISGIQLHEFHWLLRRSRQQLFESLRLWGKPQQAFDQGKKLQKQIE
ncbi:MAG: hypothetical protein EZS28_052843, partial [Streblomastix strix]